MQAVFGILTRLSFIFFESFLIFIYVTNLVIIMTNNKMLKMTTEKYMEYKRIHIS